jgi:tetratricopeptide (TPR) repeat protein
MRMSAWVPAAAVALVASQISVLPVGAQDLSKARARDIPRLMTEADKFVADNDPARAEAHLKAIVGLDPKQSQAAFKLARLCEARKDSECAMANYQLALGALTGADKAQAHLGLAAGHLQAERFPDAAEHAGAALAIDGSLTPAHVIRAVSLGKTKSPDALAAAEQAAKVAPDDARVQAVLGEALVAANRGADAEAPLRKALSLDPKLASAAAQLAQIVSAKGDHDATIVAVGQALGLDPNRRDLYALRGRAYLAKGDGDKALQDLYAAASAAPNDTGLQLTLGQIQQKQRRYDAAAQQYRNVLAVSPQQTDALLGLTDVLITLQDLEGARPYAAKAAAALPENARAQYLQARILEHDKQVDPALAAYAKAASLDPKMAEAFHGQGRLLREHKKDIPNALASMEKAAALDAANAGILTDLGAVQYEAKQVDKAIETLQKAVATPDYKHPMGLAVLGLALKDKGQYAAAIAPLEQAADLAPKWWMPRWGAAWAYFGQFKKGCPCGPDDQARIQKMQAHYDQMVALGGKDAGLAERVKMLASGLKVK